MKQENKALERRQFLSMVGKSALGLWLLQLLPSVPALARPVRKKAPSRTPAAARRVKAHPQAVKRTNRG